MNLINKLLISLAIISLFSCTPVLFDRKMLNRESYFKKISEYYSKDFPLRIKFNFELKNNRAIYEGTGVAFFDGERRVRMELSTLLGSFCDISYDGDTFLVYFNNDNLLFKDSFGN